MYWRPTWAVIQVSDSLSLGRQFCLKERDRSDTCSLHSFSFHVRNEPATRMSLQQEQAALLLYYGLRNLLFPKSEELDLVWMSEEHSHFCSALSPCTSCIWSGSLKKYKTVSVSKPGTSPSTHLPQLPSRCSCPNLIRLSFWVSQFLRGY